MKHRALLLTLALSAPATAGLAQGRPTTTMPAFASSSEMTAFLRRYLAARNTPSRRMLSDMGAPTSAAPATAGAMGAAEARVSTDAITNVQHAGVDEGDIVKLRGDYLVILRRGRLFTVAVGGSDLRPASAGNAYGTGINPYGTWYDEMLIAGDKIVVIGYSYERGGTEAGIFRLGDDGSLHYLSTFQLRSNDYYSSRNYASRLVGTKLIFYAPLYLDDGDLAQALPAVRRWNRQTDGRGFDPIARPERMFHPVGWRTGDDIALHTVTSCELDAPAVACQASVVVGPPGRVFYVSPTAVYVWMTGSFGRAGAKPGSLLVRMPLDGSAPSAQRVTGSPVDQFSFLESGDGYVNVLTAADANGDAMWEGESAGGPVKLLRLPIDSMGDGRRAAPSWWYRALPPVVGGTFQNRFVGNYLLYGTGSGWGGEEVSSRVLIAVPWRGGDVSALVLAHGTDRIEVMGDAAVVVGVRGSDLEFSGIRLRGRPAIAQRFTMREASQGELRSHGFFYRPDGSDTGVLGLPVREEGRPGSAHLVEGSASVLFLRNAEGRFSRLGTLAAGDVRSADDGCRASCVDWYGNARPVFARGRIFALMGYEIVEGQLRDGAIREVRRVNFLRVAQTASRPS